MYSQGDVLSPSETDNKIPQRHYIILYYILQLLFMHTKVWYLVGLLYNGAMM